MRCLKQYQIDPSNVSHGIFAKIALVRMGKNVQLLSVSARTSDDETKPNEEFVVSVFEEECEIADGEAYEFFMVRVWANKEKYKCNYIRSDNYMFLNTVQVGNEAYIVFYRQLIN